MYFFQLIVSLTSSIFILHFTAKNIKWSIPARKNCTDKVCFPKSLPSFEEINCIFLSNSVQCFVKILTYVNLTQGEVNQNL